MSPQVIGRAGGGLESPGWLREDRLGAGEAGRKGELLTAELLRRLCVPGGPTVMHDLRLPSDRYRANLDHLVVSGRDVWIIDSKLWQPGIYWTLGGVTRRGWRRAPHLDKRTPGLAVACLGQYLSGSGGRVAGHITLVWPSRPAEKLSIRWYRPSAGKAMDSTRALRLLSSRARRPADPGVVRLLERLLPRPPAPAPGGPAWED